MQWLKWILIVVLVLVAAALLAGRLGWLQGRAPGDLGVRDGRLKPPARTPNSVSSQAALYPDHPRRQQAQIEPRHYQGDGAAAMARHKRVVEAMPGARLQRSEPGYLYATYTTPLMRYVDDVEFALDPAAGVIQVRSASRLGHGDRGLNRERIEDVRRRFDAAR
jgi:uncharacterized protein (DUF1499 family)